MRKTFVNVVNQDLTPLLSGIKNDTLLIWGDKDTATPLEYAKLMELLFDGADPGESVELGMTK